MGEHKHRIKQILESSLLEKRSHISNHIFADVELRKLKDRDDIFIQFTDTPKVGLNPMTHTSYQTPAGIYMYPLKQTWSKRDGFVYAPFGGRRDYINVFQIDESMRFDVTEYESSNLYKDFEKIVKYLETRYQIDSTQLPHGMHNAESEYWTGLRRREIISPMAPLMKLCEDIRKTINQLHYNQVITNFPWVCNGILRNLGYKVITDINGTGTIHENEPIQAFSLSKSYINFIMRVENKKSRPKGNPDINDENEQISFVKSRPEALKGIRNPSEKVQLAAVKKDGMVIRNIDNPSEEVQLAAVKQNHYSIRYIQNPTQEAQVIAVKKSPWSIQYIQNPSEEAQLKAIKEDYKTIGVIKNPTEKVQLEAIQDDFHAIAHINDPSEKIQLAAVRKNYWAIAHIESPTERVQLEVVVQDHTAIAYIQEPTKIVRELARELSQG